MMVLVLCLTFVLVVLHTPACMQIALINTTLEKPDFTVLVYSFILIPLNKCALGKFFNTCISNKTAEFLSLISSSYSYRNKRNLVKQLALLLC